MTTMNTQTVSQVVPSRLTITVRPGQSNMLVTTVGSDWGAYEGVMFEADATDLGTVLEVLGSYGPEVVTAAAEVFYPSSDGLFHIVKSCEDLRNNKITYVDKCSSLQDHVKDFTLTGGEVEPNSFVVDFIDWKALTKHFLATDTFRTYDAKNGGVHIFIVG